MTSEEGRKPPRNRILKAMGEIATGVPGITERQAVADAIRGAIRAWSDAIDADLDAEEKGDKEALKGTGEILEQAEAALHDLLQVPIRFEGHVYFRKGDSLDKRKRVGVMGHKIVDLDAEGPIDKLYYFGPHHAEGGEG
jgi:hypothetical protein